MKKLSFVIIFTVIAITIVILVSCNEKKVTATFVFKTGTEIIDGDLAHTWVDQPNIFINGKSQPLLDSSSINIKPGKYILEWRSFNKNGLMWVINERTNRKEISIDENKENVKIIVSGDSLNIKYY